MPWNNGAYNRTDGEFSGREVWKQNADSRQVVSSGKFDVHDQDLADGINAAIAKDGSNEATNNIPMAGFKFVNVGPSVESDEYFTRRQAFMEEWITFQQFANRSIGVAKLDTTTPAGETPARQAIATWDADAGKISFVPPDTLIAATAQPAQISGTYNAIGSFCFAGNRISALGPLQLGGTIPGSKLYAAAFNGREIIFTSAGGSLAGTWRLLGGTPSATTTRDFATLFFRVS